MKPDVTNGMAASMEGTQMPADLTERECRILRLIFSGMPSHDVAETLGLGKRTVDFYVATAYAKLGVSNRYRAYQRAVDLGIISA